MRFSRILFIIGAILVLSGVAGIVYSIIIGNVMIHIFLIIPVMTIKGTLGSLSLLSFFFGFMIMMISLFTSGKMYEKGNTPRKREYDITDSREKEWGGVIFIGPFPIIFGDDNFSRKIPR